MPVCLVGGGEEMGGWGRVHGLHGLRALNLVRCEEGPWSMRTRRNWTIACAGHGDVCCMGNGIRAGLSNGPKRGEAEFNQREQQQTAKRESGPRCIEKAPTTPSLKDGPRSMHATPG